MLTPIILKVKTVVYNRYDIVWESLASKEHSVLLIELRGLIPTDLEELLCNYNYGLNIKLKEVLTNANPSN